MNRFLSTLIALLVLALLPAALFAQQNPPKFAVVIGNSSYTSGLSPLVNPANDANDIASSLEKLGFTVDKVLNGNQEQMENAIMRLKTRLSSSSESYGFFFYAGHGVQSGGANYLIPIGANIPTENMLRNRAVPVQWIMDELNDARNGLNVVVLDACRDNPFSWSRSGTRGLSIVSTQPPDSIVVYATSAGQTASDGEGRNGLFTSHLLKNITIPEFEIMMCSAIPALMWQRQAITNKSPPFTARFSKRLTLAVHRVRQRARQRERQRPLRSPILPGRKLPRLEKKRPLAMPANCGRWAHHLDHHFLFHG